MNTYEILYIIDNSVEESQRDALIAQYEAMVVSNGGSVDKVDKWGDKRFAYTIDYKDNGFYVLMTFKSNSSFPKEIERKMSINEHIVRWMTIKKE